MAYVILVTVLLLVQYTYFAMRAGGARGKGEVEVKAPATSGDAHYECCNRIHLNTLEQIVVTLPAMWICAVYFKPMVAAGLGLVFLIGRGVYSMQYLKDPATRAPGMIIGFLANVALLLCCLYVAVMML